MSAILLCYLTLGIHDSYENIEGIDLLLLVGNLCLMTYLYDCDLFWSLIEDDPLSHFTKLFAAHFGIMNTDMCSVILKVVLGLGRYGA